MEVGIDSFKWNLYYPLYCISLGKTFFSIFYKTVRGHQFLAGSKSLNVANIANCFKSDFSGGSQPLRPIDYVTSLTKSRFLGHMY